MKPLYKHLYLPSGGKFYDPQVKYETLNFNFQLYELTKVFDSQIEFFVAVIDSITVLPVDINELYIQDFFYIWTNVLLTEILDSKKDYEINDICNKCNTLNSIEIQFGDLNFIQKNKWENFNLYFSEELLINDEKYILKFRHRQVKDNFTYSTLGLNNKTELIHENYVNYLLTALEGIYHGDNKIEEIHYVDFFNNCNRKVIKSLHNKYLKFSEEFGMENTIQWKCKKCETKNSGLIFNNMINSIIAPSVYDKKKIQEFYGMIFSWARLPVFTYFEIMNNVPIKFASEINEALKEQDFQAGVVMA